MTPFQYKKISDFLERAASKQMLRKLRPIKYISAKECLINDKKCLNFSSNNYLGLTDHPYIKEQMIKWTEKYGTGSGASRLVSGTMDEYIELEKKIADWKGKKSALILSSGYTANIGVISAIADRHSVIFADKLNHASLNAGCVLSGAKVRRYKHNNPEHLNYLFEKASGEDNVIITDTVFSMDGDTVNEEIFSKYAGKALTYADDAHATGIFGDKGQGLATSDKCDIIMGTFSKAMGIYGAYIACSEEMKKFLINRCGSFVYSTALPPCIYGGIKAALDIMDTYEFQLLRTTLVKKAKILRTKLKEMGLDIGSSATHIIPLIIGDVEKTLELANFLMENNIFAAPIRPPTVPVNTARIRISVSAAHSERDIEYLLSVLKKWRESNSE